MPVVTIDVDAGAQSSHDKWGSSAFDESAGVLRPKIRIWGHIMYYPYSITGCPFGVLILLLCLLQSATFGAGAARGQFWGPTTILPTGFFSSMISSVNYRFCVWNFKLFITELSVTGYCSLCSWNLRGNTFRDLCNTCVKSCKESSKRESEIMVIATELLGVEELDDETRKILHKRIEASAENKR